MQRNRTIYVDVLRIIAMFMVVVIHVSASNWYTSDIKSFDWLVFNVSDSMARSAVPIFVMISGMFFLNPDRNVMLKNIYKKNILRLVTAYVFWSIAYGMFMMYYTDREWNVQNIDWMINRIVNGHYILWYIPMLIGIYMLVPVLRTITEKKDKKLLEYTLFLFFIFGVFIRTVKKFDVDPRVDILINKITLDGFTGYVGYFLLGYYLYTYDFSKRLRVIIYVLGILSVICTSLVSLFYAYETNKPSNMLYGYHMITTFFEGIAIITVIKHNKWIKKLNQNTKISRKLINFSSLVFGMYLIHDMILKQLIKMGLTTVSFNLFYLLLLYL